MDKANQKDDRVTVRLPDELRNFEAFGFKNISEYIKTALTEFNSKLSFEVIKTREIINDISSLISAMEAERDYNPENFTKEKEEHLEALYMAVKPIGSTQIMEKSPLNWVESPDPEDEGEKIYAFEWTR